MIALPDNSELISSEAWELNYDSLVLRQDYYPPARNPNRKPRRVVKAPGRNEPCPCGSGRKYKKCCA